MPKDFFYETSISICHEDLTCRVDTTMRGVAASLLRAGFQEVTKPTSAPYRRFVGQADQVRFRKPKGQRISRQQAERRAEVLARARKAKIQAGSL